MLLSTYSTVGLLLLSVLAQTAVLQFNQHVHTNRFKSPDILGYFWQITDIHYDEQYSTSGNPVKMCHQNKLNNLTTNQPGIFGDYLCDAPWKLVTSAIDAMKLIYDVPDFIIWTGDSIPHVNNSDLNRNEVFKIIGNVTDKIRGSFPNITILPVLGNHDPYPSNQMPPNSNDGYYEGILDHSHWMKLLGEEQQKTFKKGGYYSSYINPRLRLLGLNTNLYYNQDTLVADKQDPADQLKWMEEQLKDARDKKEKVYIISHVPPGAFEKLQKIVWFYPQFNQQYLNILIDYSNVIVGQFYGHEHTDSFRILIDDNNKVCSSLFLSPAVTPWKSTLPGVGANNPSVRLYLYRRDTGDVLDYYQYFINLTQANSASRADWMLEYQATKEFGLSDVSALELDRLAKHFYKDEGIFQKYLRINSVGYDPNPNCTGDCKRQQICAIQYLDLDRYSQCMRETKNTTHHQRPTHHHSHHHQKHVPQYMFYIIGGMGGIIIVLTIWFTCFCVSNRKKRIPFKYGPLHAPINYSDS